MMSLALRNGCEAPDEVGALFSEYTELPDWMTPGAR